MPKKSRSSIVPVFQKTSSFIAFVIVLLGLVAGLLITRNQVLLPSKATAAPVAHASTKSGIAGSVTTISSENVTARSGSVYISAITTKPYRAVKGVSGMGLEWRKVAAQCGARSATGVEVWVGSGTPATGTVNATFEKAPENSVITVSQFDNADPATPIGQVTGANTLGVNGGCSGGTDSATYSLTTTAVPNSITFAVVAERLRSNTPGNGFTEITEVQSGKSDGDKAGIALMYAYNSASGSKTTTGTLSKETDWAAVVLQINGITGTVVATPTPAASVTPVASATPVSSSTPRPTTTPVATTLPTLPPSVPPTTPTLGIWTSQAELASKPKDGPAWAEVLSAANALSDSPTPNLDNQDDKTNTDVLAAAIVYARTGEAVYKNKVVAALQKVEQFVPKGRTLAWARETGAYAIAADLVGYRTPAFEKKMRDMAEFYRCTEVKNDKGQYATMLEMFQKRPNNWGTMAFGSLTAIYSYLGDTAKLRLVRDHFVQEVSGPKPATTSFDDNLTWQCDTSKPRLINPDACVKTCEGKLVDVGGILPDDMRRGGDCKQAAVATGYPWEALQGVVMGARVLERAGMPIWQADNRAICRAAATLQSERFGSWTKATSNDLWQLPFIDRACGTNYQAAYTSSSDKAMLWKFGKNAGWGYVIY